MLEIRPILSALTRHKSTTLLTIIQVALTFAVVVNSISIINQRLALMDRDSGFAESQLITLGMNPFSDDYDFETNFRADMSLLRNIPGVIDAVISSVVPLSGSGSSSTVATSEENADSDQNMPAGIFRGDTHFLGTFGLDLVAGRNFNEDEIIYSENFVKPRVVMITQALADKLYPEQDALGEPIHFWNEQATIIGIIRTMAGPWVNSTQFMNNLIVPTISLNSFNSLVIRVEETDMASMLGSVEKLLLERNPNRVITSIRSLKETKQRSYSNHHAMTQILWAVITLLVFITALGIVGVVSFNVNQRIKQIGIKRALGAQKIDILRYFITENVLITGMGVLLGTIITIFLNNYLVADFRLSALPWIYIPIGAVIMLTMGVLAVWAPARKASRVSPVVATQTI